MKYLLLTFIIAVSNKFFSLAVLDKQGFFRGTDLGILLIFLSLVYYLTRTSNLGRLSNFFSWYIFSYFLLITIQASIACFIYEQSVLNGIIQARHQFYYLFFPLLLVTLRDEGAFSKFMAILTVFSIILIVLSVINYFGPTIFVGDLALGRGERSGFVRAYVPGLQIIAMTGIWLFNKYLTQNKLVCPLLFIFLFIFSGVVFAQTRGILIPFTFILFLMLVLKKRTKLAVTAVIVFVVFLSTSSLILRRNVPLSLFQQTYTDIRYSEGTVRGRLEQVEQSLAIFKNTMWFGSGAITLRDASNSGLAAVAFDSDLGYIHWLKFFGIPGIFLFISMAFVFYRSLLRCLLRSNASPLLSFAGFHMTFILIAAVTQNYFTSTRKIPLLCLTWASLVLVRFSKPTFCESK